MAAAAPTAAAPRQALNQVFSIPHGVANQHTSHVQPLQSIRFNSTITIPNGTHQRGPQHRPSQNATILAYATAIRSAIPPSSVTSLRRYVTKHPRGQPGTRDDMFFVTIEVKATPMQLSTIAAKVANGYLLLPKAQWAAPVKVYCDAGPLGNRCLHLTGMPAGWTARAVYDWLRTGGHVLDDVCPFTDHLGYQVMGEFICCITSGPPIPPGPHHITLPNQSTCRAYFRPADASAIVRPSPSARLQPYAPPPRESPHRPILPPSHSPHRTPKSPHPQPAPPRTTTQHTSPPSHVDCPMHAHSSVHAAVVAATTSLPMTPTSRAASTQPPPASIC